MSDQPRLSVIVPARNEASRLEATCRALASALAGDGQTEFIFVLDASSNDDTIKVGTKIDKEYPSVRLEIVGSRGKGHAVARGVVAARGATVLLADADLAVNPIQFERLIRPAAAGALAIASRSVAGSRRIGEPPTRFIAGRLFNAAVRLLVLPGVHDTQCGFKAFPRSVFVPVFERLESEGWCFDVELIAHARRLRVAVLEVPVEWRYGHGSKVRPGSDAPRIARELLDLRRRYGRVP